jgi:hypothetical protein
MLCDVPAAPHVRVNISPNFRTLQILPRDKLKYGKQNRWLSVVRPKFTLYDKMEVNIVLQFYNARMAVIGRYDNSIAIQLNGSICAVPRYRLAS